MTELHHDRLLDGGTDPRPTAAGTLRTAPAASPSRRRPWPGKARRTTPQGRQGETSSAAESTPTRNAGGLEVRAVVLTGNTVVDPPGDDRAAAPADVVEEVLAAEPVTAVADAAELVEAADAQALAVVAGPAAEVRPGDGPVASSPRRSRFRVPRRRPAFYLAAALVGALAVGSTSAGDGVARAHGTEPVSSSVSVAEELGLDREDLAADAAAQADAAALGEVTASRNAREAEAAAAAQAQAEADRVAAEAAAAAAAEAARPKAVLPVAGGRLTSTFGARWGTLHAGIDLAAPMLTPEYAAADGVVLEAGPASGYGNAVYIQHDNGDVTVYGHMEEILVQPGQVVRAGDTIALLGNRGQSTGPHLHFEVHVGGIDGQKIDPIPWLQERGVSVS
ncbi:Peptidase family M23 [Geodermatophilus saharensis]|uniref:Peptidase family M23 n=1 Tax=Geodermatophilus saharensis TaxID=1137994 RepID=A0A239J1B4_9ACTN|nr:M23 family metallopeptidase [Geodermatophilus saharensis]SNS99442.1 Peptidase family M23 [Geodermatophilus saharensis]